MHPISLNAATHAKNCLIPDHVVHQFYTNANINANTVASAFAAQMIIRVIDGQ